MIDGPRIGAIVLAAGASSRMGERRDKLVEDVTGMRVVDRVVHCAIESRADPVVVVVADRAGRVATGLPRAVRVVENTEHASGLSTSLIAGLRALHDVDGAVVLLGDMPLVTPGDVDALIDSFRPDAVSVPVVDGRRGNPVLWPHAWFGRIFELRGDRGARSLIDADPSRTVTVPRDNRGLLVDVDTPDDLDAVRDIAARS